MRPELIDAVPLFDGTPRRVRREAPRWADELDVPAGRLVVREGEYAREFFVIVDGAAEVVKDGETVAVLGPGEFFGELGLLGGDLRTASVVAATPLRLLVVAAREFRTMLDALPQVADRVRAVAARRA